MIANIQCQEERARTRKLEEELTRIKRAQGPGRSPLSPNPLSPNPMSPSPLSPRIG